MAMVQAGGSGAKMKRGPNNITILISIEASGGADIVVVSGGTSDNWMPSRGHRWFHSSTLHSQTVHQ
jgi:hypothetical protein